MNELKMPQVGASRSEIVANWQPDNPEFWEKFGKKKLLNKTWLYPQLH